MARKRSRAITAAATIFAAQIVSVRIEPSQLALGQPWGHLEQINCIYYFRIFFAIKFRRRGDARDEP
jgi:hypothetical protein